MAKGPADAHALLVGVASYADSAYDLPDGVRNDVVDLANLLRSPCSAGYPTGQVHVLLDDAATADAIRAGLRSIAAATTPDSTVVVQFSGHGGLESVSGVTLSYLVPHDGDAADLTSTAIESGELAALLAQVPAQRLLLLLDACHAGGAKLKSSASRRFVPGFADKSLAALSRGIGRVIIASSREDETSGIELGASNSIFTAHLLDALRGKADRGDGIVRVLDLFNYVSAAVQAQASQHPVLKADMEDNFAIAVSPRSPGAGSAKNMSLRDGDWWRTAERVLAALYPSGPDDREVWSRAGGDLSQIVIGGPGRASWHAALRTLRQGGGGAEADIDVLLAEARSDFANNPELSALMRHVD